jgi:folate-binding protein YgfZ
MFSPNSTAFHIWQPAAWLRVSGEDASNFIQGQLTNDLRNLMARGAVYGLWLNQKGRVVADSFVMRGNEPGVFCLGSYFSSAAVIRERLEAYIIADDVVIEDQSAEWRGVSVFGAVEHGALRQAIPNSLVFSGRRGTEESSEWIFPAAEEVKVRTLLAKGSELNEVEMERRRVMSGIPSVPQDIGLGELPNEGGLERDAISYTKGCYLGQEVMARLKSMGKVRRKLQRVTGSGAPPAVPVDLWQDGRKVGELRSIAPLAEGYAGLALLTLMHVQPAMGLSLAADTAPTITLTETA